MRVFFILNIALWCVLFLAWLVYIALMGLGDFVSIRVAFILAITAVLLEIQAIIRWRRGWRLRVSA